MAKPKFLHIVEQVAAYLRDEIKRGRWGTMMPGMNSLAPELGVNVKTVESALRILEKQGILESQGAGRRRKINLDKITKKTSALRVQIFLYEKSDLKIDYLLEIYHLLQEAGHDVNFSAKTLTQLGMDVGRVARFVKATESDAWVVCSASRDVLEWFSQQDAPAFALFGRLVEVALPSISPKKADAYREAVDQLLALGHQRIVYLVREERRKPTPGFLEQLFLDQLESNGVKAGIYNLPDWEVSPEGLETILTSMFQHTPPTAMIIDGPILFHVVRAYLGNHGIVVPDDVSMICTDPDLSFHWCLPKVTHIDWNSRTFVLRVVKWVNNISIGKDDQRKSTTKAKLILGGTIGPAP